MQVNQFPREANAMVKKAWKRELTLHLPLIGKENEWFRTSMQEGNKKRTNHRTMIGNI